MSGANGHAAASAADRFAAAHRALRADPSIQFSLRPVEPPPPPPQWLVDFGKWLGRVLRPVARFFDWIGSFLPDAPFARILLWIVIAAVLLAIAWMAYERIRHGEWRLPRWRHNRAEAVDMPEEVWSPGAAPVRQWLAEADALAAQGRFAEAVHHLLFRSVEDIARRRPHAVRPALTSRELSRAEAIPSAARGIFGGIARLVERSLFGGRQVSAGDWTTARDAYAGFALPATWRE